MKVKILTLLIASMCTLQAMDGPIPTPHAPTKRPRAMSMATVVIGTMLDLLGVTFQL